MTSTRSGSTGTPARRAWSAAIASRSSREPAAVGVARLALAQRAGAGLDGGGRRREVGLADLEVEHVRAGALEREGALHHLHREERLARCARERAAPRVCHRPRVPGVSRARALGCGRRQLNRSPADLARIRAMSKGVQVAGGATLVALLLAWYAAPTRGGRLLRLLPDARRVPGSAARAAGPCACTATSRSGSIERDVAGEEVRFHVQNKPPHAGGAPGQPLAVIFASLETPDLFKDGAEVVVEGRLRRRATSSWPTRCWRSAPRSSRAPPARPAAI